MHEDTLFIIAEIAAAFAGFASLVAAIANRNSRSTEEEDLNFSTLKNVLVISLLTLAFALAPVVLEKQGLGFTESWRISGAGFTIIFGLYLSGSVFREIVPAYRSANRRIPVTLVANTVLAYSVVLIMALCALGVVEPIRYLLGLAAMLYFSGAGFLRFFVSVWSRPAPNKSLESDA